MTTNVWYYCATVQEMLLYACDRWHGLHVRALNLRVPLTVMLAVTVQETLDILSREGFDQVPVVDESGYVSVLSMFL